MDKKLYDKLVAQGNTVYKGDFWAGFKKAGNDSTGGGLGFCQDCDDKKMQMTYCNNGQRCEEHHKLYIHMRNVDL